MQQSYFYIARSSDLTFQTVAFGVGSDQAIPRDYDGDGRTDIAIYRTGATSTAVSRYWILQSLTNSVRVENWGVGADFSENTYDVR